MALNLLGESNPQFALIFFPNRSFASIIPDVTIEEISFDGMQITDHPVEIGAPISDHAFLKPSALEIRYGFSNSSAKSAGYVQQVYGKFLEIRAAREPFQVSTGKRLYTNMMLAELRIVTDVSSEFALMVTAYMREIFVTRTSGGGVGSPFMSSAIAPFGAEANIGNQNIVPSASFNQVSPTVDFLNARAT